MPPREQQAQQLARRASARRPAASSPARSAAPAHRVEVDPAPVVAAAKATRLPAALTTSSAPGRRPACPRARARPRARCRARRRCARPAERALHRGEHAARRAGRRRPRVSKRTCLPSVCAASRAARSSAVNSAAAGTQPQAARRPRAPAELAIDLLDRARAEPRSREATVARSSSASDSARSRRRARARSPCAAARRVELREQRSASCASATRSRKPRRSAASCAWASATPVEQRVQLRDVGAHRAQRRRSAARAAGRLPRAAGAGSASSAATSADDCVEQPQERRRCAPAPRPRALAQRRQRVLEACARSAISRLLDHPRRALERVREAQQPATRSGAAGALLELEHALAELLEQLARLDAEVAVGILGHRLTPCACGWTRRSRSLRERRQLGGGLQRLTELASVSRVACATLAIATLTCSTAVVCCLVDSSISRAASVVVATSPAICLNASGHLGELPRARRRPPSSRSRWPSRWC